jgi:predicted DNA-binding transcriptional regulator AlpA
MKLLSNDETADLLGLKPATLDNWRWRGVGPSFVRVGSRVKYAENDVLAWINEQTRRSTSDKLNVAVAQR